MPRIDMRISLILLLFPLVMLIPGITGFTYPSQDAVYSDAVVTHYPNALFLQRTLAEIGQIPLWSPAILSGYPFFANPLSGLHYPLGWFSLLFPLPLGINITVLIHILFGGIGMYLFLRSQKLDYLPSLFGALIFEMLPKTYAHYGAGHVTLLYSFSWTPWLLYFRSGTTRFRIGIYSIIFALMFLADPRWALIAGAMWFFWEITDLDGHVTWRFFRFGIMGGLALLLASPLAFPLAEYARLSSRSHLSMNDIFAFSLPPTRLFGLVFPDFSGYHEWIVYFGGLVVCLILVTLVTRTDVPRKTFWLVCMLLSILFSLGNNLFLMTYLAHLPIFSLMRVPPRALFLTGMAAAYLAAAGLHVLLQPLTENRKKSIRLWVVFVITFVLGISIPITYFTRRIEANIVWGSISILVAGVLVLYLLREKVSPKGLIWLVFPILLLDLGYTDLTLFEYRPVDVVLREGRAAAEYLASIQGPFRVYSPSYSLPQQTASFYRLEQADGVDPLQLEEYVDFMAAATGIPSKSYSITVPPFGETDPSTANKQYLPNSLLKILNVRFIVSEFELDIQSSKPEKFGETWLYDWDPGVEYAHMEPSTSTFPMLVSRTPNRIEISASGPGTLVISEIPYPGWLAYIDGVQASWEPYDGVNRSVSVPAGDHSVVFVLRPTSLYLGLGISVITLGAILRWESSRREDTF